MPEVTQEASGRAACRVLAPKCHALLNGHIHPRGKAVAGRLRCYVASTALCLHIYLTLCYLRQTLHLPTITLLLSAWCHWSASPSFTAAWDTLQPSCVVFCFPASAARIISTIRLHHQPNAILSEGSGNKQAKRLTWRGWRPWHLFYHPQLPTDILWYIPLVFLCLLVNMLSCKSPSPPQVCWSV